MKKLLIILIASGVIASCSILVNPYLKPSTKYSYRYQLTSPVISQSMNYSDSILSISFHIDDKRISFDLKNTSNDPMKINWINAVFIDSNSGSSKIVHKGEKYISGGENKTPTIIYPQTIENEFVIPVNHVHFIQESGEWFEIDLLPSVDNNSQAIKDYILGLKGKNIEFILPIIRKDKELNYRFVFNINDVVPNGKG